MCRHCESQSVNAVIENNQYLLTHSEKKNPHKSASVREMRKVLMLKQAVCLLIALCLN